MKSVIDGVSRMSKLLTNLPNSDDILVSAEEFDNIMKTVDYHMSCYCGYDQVIEKCSGSVIAHTKGRGANAICYIDKAFADRINLREES